MVIAGIVFGLFAALIAVIAEGFDDESAARMILTPMISVIGGSIVIVTAPAIEKQRCLWLMWPTLALALLTIGYWFIWLWTAAPDDVESLHLKVLGTLSAVVVALTVAGQLLAADAGSDAARVYCRAAALWTLLYAGWIVAFVWSTRMQRYGDTLGPGTVVGGLVTIAMLTVARIWLAPRKTRGPSESLSSRPSLRMTCPGCQREQTHTAGLVRCPHCRFVMIIEMEEPRCQCGYLLYRLTGDTCPECGRAVASRPTPTRT